MEKTESYPEIVHICLDCSKDKECLKEFLDDNQTAYKDHFTVVDNLFLIWTDEETCTICGGKEKVCEKYIIP